MKLRILSDLHIEFHPFVIPPLADDAQTVLILAGDIGVIRRHEELAQFLKQAAAQFFAVVYVLGNHEYYAGLWLQALDTLGSWNLPDNVHVLEREAVAINGVLFAGTTLWSDFEKADPAAMQAANAMNDYHYIRTTDFQADEPRALHPKDVLHDHYRSLEWLDQT